MYCLDIHVNICIQNVLYSIVFFEIIPVNGNWGEWSSSGSCSKACGGGVISKTRSCDSPAPSGSGADCEGDANTDEPCNEQACSGISKATDLHPASTDDFFF